jgi:hypothetical protein
MYRITKGYTRMYIMFPPEMLRARNGHDINQSLGKERSVLHSEDVIMLYLYDSVGRVLVLHLNVITMEDLSIAK